MSERLEDILANRRKKLDEIKHSDLAPKKVFKKLRKADLIEIKAGKITEYKK